MSEVVCDMDPLVPVTATAKSPTCTAVVQDNVAVWGEVPNVTLGMSVQVVLVRLMMERSTVPVKPFKAFRVMVELPEPPARIWAGETAPADMEKSGTTAGFTVSERFVVWLAPPPVAVMVMVAVPVVAVAVAVNEAGEGAVG